jgi:hypothetical protein
VSARGDLLGHQHAGEVIFHRKGERELFLLSQESCRRLFRKALHLAEKFPSLTIVFEGYEVCGVLRADPQILSRRNFGTVQVASLYDACEGLPFVGRRIA